MNGQPWTYREIGTWAARAVCILILIYIITGAVWFVSSGDSSKRYALAPTDPYLAILEALIVLMGPLMVLTMASLHGCTSRETSTFSLASLSFMILLAGITCSIHFVELFVMRRVSPEAMVALSPIISSPWKWPSAAFALDLLAWDMFYGLSMLCGGAAFARTGETVLSRLMFLSGGLCVAGITGPVVGDLRFQLLGIMGYAGGGRVVFFLLSRALVRANPFGAQNTSEHDKSWQMNRR